MGDESADEYYIQAGSTRLDTPVASRHAGLQRPGNQ
ncbi:Uncharacterised protein [Mobiluncus mulieris]|nr:Uncharacterised protein [Mobiluncus mulieris]